MGKKIKRTKVTSKGQRPSINNKLLTAVKNAVPYVISELNIVDAWKSGKNPWVTIANPRGEKNKPYIKVKADDYWGSPRATFNINKNGTSA